MTQIMHQVEPYVTVFTAEIPYVCKHGDEVTLGGKVTRILRASDIVEDADALPDTENGAYLVFDDEVGDTAVFITQRALELFESANGPISIGDVLLASGRIHELDVIHREEQDDGTVIVTHVAENYTIRLFAYGLAKVPDKNGALEESAE